jgi:flagellar basal-body rod protein FlgC
MNISTSGMAAERFRMDVIAGNIANANSSKVGNQEPYRRKDVVLTGTSNGVEVSQVVDDMTPFQMKYDPGNPNHDQNGFVETTNVQPVNEMVDMMSATRSYEANIAAFNTTKTMIRDAFTLAKA